MITDLSISQVRKFCPNTPVILVGCKNDVRFMLNDEQYLNYCRERSPLVRCDPWKTCNLTHVLD